MFGFRVDFLRLANFVLISLQSDTKLIIVEKKDF